MSVSFEGVVAGLGEQGWVVEERFIAESLARELAGECRRRAQAGLLEPAAVGRAEAQQVQPQIRSDRIQWLEPGQSETVDAYLQLMDDLRLELNRNFFFGLEEFECHFALFPEGAFYQTHLDRFRDEDSRTVTAVLYLNEDWQPEHEGCMRLHLGESTAVDVPPRAGTLVVFLSGELPHEVLPTRAERLSLTGWFRRRPICDTVLWSVTP